VAKPIVTSANVPTVVEHEKNVVGSSKELHEHEHKSVGTKVKDFFTGKHHKEKKEKKKLEKEGLAHEHKVI